MRAMPKAVCCVLAESKWGAGGTMHAVYAATHRLHSKLLRAS